MSNIVHHPASFKDPSGFVFQQNNIFYRQVNKSYQEEYDLLMSSGLYDKLVSKGYLLPHEEIDQNFSGSDDWYKTILPRQLGFISYAYEWCFGQLKSAALLTLAIQKMALEFGMILKDATHYNVQFVDGKPVFIDTLSFEKYDPLQPWVAYRQFCECFLFPLLLQKYIKLDIQKLMLSYPDGVPATVTKELLPWKSVFNLGVGLHVSLPSRIKPGSSAIDYKGKFDSQKMLHLVSNLQDNVRACMLHKKNKTTWSNYYDETITSKSYLSEKESVFRKVIGKLLFETVLDVGANDGFFSKIIAEKAKDVISIDFDCNCINSLYSNIRKQKIQNILPLCIDFANPSPAIGFNNKERSAFLKRAEFDLVIALAVVHHLAISKNIPLTTIAQSFQGLGKKLVIEFVPKDDDKVKLLLQNRKDIFTNYNQPEFEKAFGEYFTIDEVIQITGTLPLDIHINSEMKP